MNAGRSLPSDSAVVSPRTPSSAVTTIGSPLRCGIATGTTSSSKTPFFQASAAFWCERGGERVLLLAGELHALGVDLLGQHAHRLLGGLVVERVVRHRVDERTSPNLKPSRDFGRRCGALVIDSMPPATTISHSPARISWSAIAMAFEARQADLVDRDRRHAPRQAAGDAGGAGRVLAGAGQDDLAHDQVVDLLRLHARLLQRALDGDATELGRREALEAAEEAADRGARTRDDDGRTGHEEPPELVGGTLADLTHGSGARRGWKTSHPLPAGHPPYDDVPHEHPLRSGTRHTASRHGRRTTMAA